jgi:hypothetical protein
VAQVVMCLLCNCKALSSNPGTAKNQQEELFLFFNCPSAVSHTKQNRSPKRSYSEKALRNRRRVCKAITLTKGT